MDKRLDSGGTFTELAKEARAQLRGKKEGSEGRLMGEVGSGRSQEEERLRELQGKSTRLKEG